MGELRNGHRQRSALEPEQLSCYNPITSEAALEALADANIPFTAVLCN